MDAKNQPARTSKGAMTGPEEVAYLRGVIEKASTHLHNIAVGLEELRDKQRRSRVLESDKPLPDNLIPSAAIYGKAIRMTQRDLMAALDAFDEEMAVRAFEKAGSQEAQRP